MALTCCSFIFVNPNFSVQIDKASSAAGSMRLSTFSELKNLSIQANNAWKYPYNNIKDNDDMSAWSRTSAFIRVLNEEFKQKPISYTRT